jgi:hypothetical protein
MEKVVKHRRVYYLLREYGIGGLVAGIIIQDAQRKSTKTRAMDWIKIARRSVEMKRWLARKKLADDMIQPRR